MKLKIILFVLLLCVNGVLVLINFDIFPFYQKTDKESRQLNEQDILQTYDLNIPIRRSSIIWTPASPILANEMQKSYQVGFLNEEQQKAFATLVDRTILDIESDVPNESMWFTVGPINDVFIQNIREHIGNEAMDALVLEQAIRENPLVEYALVAEFLQHLFYKYPFTKLSSLRFGRNRVKSFGIEKYNSKDSTERNQASQVHIVDYRSADDFIVLLDAEEHPETIILAKLSPASTLAETVDSVLQRLKEHPRSDMAGGSDLQIPNLSVKTVRDFDIFHDMTLNGDPVRLWRQYDRFVLNEKEVKVHSVVIALVENGGDEHVPPQYIFDKPFLVMLKQPDSRRPYCVLWVQNAAIMETLSNAVTMEFLLPCTLPIGGLLLALILCHIVVVPNVKDALSGLALAAISSVPLLMWLLGIVTILRRYAAHLTGSDIWKFLIIFGLEGLVIIVLLRRYLQKQLLLFGQHQIGDRSQQEHIIQHATAIHTTVSHVVITLIILGTLVAFFMPNFLIALQRSNRSRTAADIRAIGTALGSYQVDHKMFPLQQSEAPFTLDLLPTAYYNGTIYDAWGNLFYYISDGKHYTLVSYGKDHAIGKESGEFDHDIVFADGQFR